MLTPLVITRAVVVWTILTLTAMSVAEPIDTEPKVAQQTGSESDDAAPSEIISNPIRVTAPNDDGEHTLSADLEVPDQIPVFDSGGSLSARPTQNNDPELLPTTETAVALPKSLQNEPLLSTPQKFPVVSEETASQPWAALELLGKQVAANQRVEIRWTTGQSFDGSEIKTPITVIRGASPGPTLCLTAAVHGDEVNGVEIVRRILSEIAAEDLSGSVIGAPIVNILGFARGSRYLPDRRDLNRYFPGQPNGSFASRIAYVFFNEIVRHCDALVDFHTGSFKRTNLPQLRADLSLPAVKDFVENFGATAVLNKSAAPGTLRGAANAAGIPAVAFELGGPITLQLESVEFGVKAIDTLLDKLGMIKRFRLWSEPQPIFYRSRWLRSHHGGILSSSLALGNNIKKNDLLGWVTNPITNERAEIRSPFNGRLLGRALNQFVLPGFAVFHIGIQATDKVGLVEDGATGDVGTREINAEETSEIVVEDFPDDNETH